MTRKKMDKIINWLVPFVCGGAASAIAAYFALFCALRDGMQCLLRAQIIQSYEKYMERGHCPVEIKESLRREYRSYHKLGGNDVATGMYRELLELPTHKPTEEKDNEEKGEESE